VDVWPLQGKARQQDEQHQRKAAAKQAAQQASVNG
jgi:hypothetical protein